MLIWRGSAHRVAIHEGKPKLCWRVSAHRRSLVLLARFCTVILHIEGRPCCIGEVLRKEYRPCRVGEVQHGPEGRRRFRPIWADVQGGAVVPVLQSRGLQKRQPQESHAGAHGLPRFSAFHVQVLITVTTCRCAQRSGVNRFTAPRAVQVRTATVARGRRGVAWSVLQALGL